VPVSEQGQRPNFSAKNNPSRSRFAIHLRLGEKPAETGTFRQAHYLKVAGSNPAPTTNDFKKINTIPQGAKEPTSEAKFKLWVFKCGQGY